MYVRLEMGSTIMFFCRSTSKNTVVYLIEDHINANVSAEIINSSADINFGEVRSTVKSSVHDKAQIDDMPRTDKNQ